MVGSAFSVRLLLIASATIDMVSTFMAKSKIISHSAELMSNEAKLPLFSMSAGLSPQAFM